MLFLRYSAVYARTRAELLIEEAGDKEAVPFPCTSNPSNFFASLQTIDYLHNAVSDEEAFLLDLDLS